MISWTPVRVSRLISDDKSNDKSGNSTSRATNVMFANTQFLYRDRLINGSRLNAKTCKINNASITFIYLPLHISGCKYFIETIFSQRSRVCAQLAINDWYQRLNVGILVCFMKSLQSRYTITLRLLDPLAVECDKQCICTFRKKIASSWNQNYNNYRHHFSLSLTFLCSLHFVKKINFLKFSTRWKSRSPSLYVKIAFAC